MILRKFSEHGLGHLLNPLNPSDESTDWIKAMWEIIDNEAQGFPIQRPEWFGLPAVGRETASSPTLVQRLTPKKRTRLPYADRIKPMNFLLTAHVAPFGHPQGVDPKEFRLIAPFNTDFIQMAAYALDGHTLGKHVCDHDRSERRFSTDQS